MSQRVIVIVLNWHRRDDTLRCLASLAQTSVALADVLVVDTASSDDSVGAIEAAFPQTQLIQNREHAGYAAGNNIALRSALATHYDFALLLNNDTIVDALAEPLLADPQRGVCGSAIASDTTRNHLLFLRVGYAPPSAWFITAGRRIRTVVRLSFRPHTRNRARGRTPMLRAMHDFMLGRFGPLGLAR